MGEPAIAQRCRDRAAIQHHLAHEIVNLAGGDAGEHLVHQRIEDVGRQPPGPAHAFEAFRAVQLDGAVAIDGHVGGDVLIFDHGGDVAP